MRSSIRALICCLAAAIASTATTAAHTQYSTLIRLQPPATADDQRDDYVMQVLELALEQTRHDFGPASLQRIGLRMTQDRAMREMRNGRYIDVLWMMTTTAREQQLTPVRIPLAAGMLGIRVPVLPKAGGHAFEEITDLAELRQYVAGQGHDWPDTRILRHNGIRVTTSTGYENLFRMLERGRFDFFPRAIKELAAEADLYQHYGLEPYPDLLLAYRAPNYFFVAPDNDALALRLETGLERALADGSLEALMRNNPTTRRALAHLESGEARVIPLENPDLPEFTPVHREELWLDTVFDANQNGGRSNP